MILARPRVTVPAHHAERFALAASAEPAGHLEGTLGGDGATDVARVARAEGILDVEPDRVQFNGEVVDVSIGQMGEGRNVGDRHSCPPFFRIGMSGLPGLFTGEYTRLGRPVLAEPGSTSGRSVVVAAATDGVSGPSRHGKYHADNEEDDPEDHKKMSKGEGRDEAR